MEEAATCFCSGFFVLEVVRMAQVLELANAHVHCSVLPFCRLRQTFGPCAWLFRFYLASKCKSNTMALAESKSIFVHTRDQISDSSCQTFKSITTTVHSELSAFQPFFVHPDFGGKGLFETKAYL